MIRALFFTLLILTSAAAGAAEPYLMVFTATWCGPCQRMKPIWRAIERKDHEVKWVDIDKSNLDEKYKVTGVPTTFVIDANGKIIKRYEGPVSFARLEEALHAAD